MTIWRERTTIRFLHILLSIPIIGFIYGPVSLIARAAFFTRWIAVPMVLLSGLWLWLKPRIAGHLYARRLAKTRDLAAAVTLKT